MALLMPARAHGFPQAGARCTRPLLLLIVAWLPLAGPAAAEPLRPLSDFIFSSFVQGRATGLLFAREKTPGPLNDLPDPDRAGGEAETQALIKRLEFSLGTPLPWEGWSIQTTTGVTGSQTQFLDLYLGWRPAEGWSIKAGRFRVPFGIDPQTSSGRLDTVERPLIYAFGNFGWVAPLGMDFVGQRDYGVRADYTGPAGFAGFAPLAAAAWVLGNGHDVESKSPAQVMARLGVSERLELADLRHELTLGVSASYGRNRFIRRSEHYLPIGATGDLATNPGAAAAADDLGDRGEASVLDGDALVRINQVVLKAETLLRRAGPYTSQGYYVTGSWELTSGDRPPEIVLRWEEAAQGYADGAHRPGQLYRAATAGVNWTIAPAWRLQADYIALLLDDRLHAFPGADLMIVQVQFGF